MKSLNFKQLSAAMLAATALALASGQSMADQMFRFTFAGATASGSGTLAAVANGNGTFTAVSGSGTETVNGITDALTLIFNPSGTGIAMSAAGAFYFDNQLFPDTATLIANGGLLFRSTTQEMNLYSVSAGSYLFYQQNQFHENTVFTLSAAGDAAVNATDATVPEPTTMFLLGAGLIGIVASRRQAHKAHA